MNNKNFGSFALLFLILISSGCTRIENNVVNQNLNCKDCNVILIGITTLRADHLSGFGYYRNTTPNIDVISSNSFVFKNAISASSWTLPSFMSIFTSTYPSEHGIKNNRVKDKNGNLVRANLKEINPNIRTLAEILNQNNYSTAAFTGDAHLNRSYGYDSGFNAYFDSAPFSGFETTLPLASEWLHRNKDKKFFLFVQGYDLHGRYELKNDTFRKFMDKNYRGKYAGLPDEQIALRDLSLDIGYLNLSEEDKKFWISLYDTKLNDADRRLGRFLSEIKGMGISNNTIIIITGDHGDELFERNRLDHGFSLYDELIHVPLIIHVPSYKQSHTISEQVRTIDIMPTILNLAEINISNSINAQMKGTSIVPFMQGQPTSLDAFSETDYLYKVFKRSLRKANGWKFIYSLDTNQKELYNLKDDPKEKNNLIDKEPKIAYELEQELFKYMYAGQDENR